MDNICRSLDLLKYDKPHSVYNRFDVRDYVKIYSICSEEVCNRVNLKLDNAMWENHSYHDPTTDKEVTMEHDYSICDLPHTDPDVDFLMRGIWTSLRSYVDSLEFHEWFSSWSGHSFIRFNRCVENKKIRRHYDGVKRLFDGKVRGDPFLSVVGKLNSDYEGGEFIMWEDTLIDLKPGQIMIFPSNFMYPHQVNTVTKGTRYSFVSWAY